MITKSQKERIALNHPNGIGNGAGIYKETTKTTPHEHRYWLKEHQITAFWHGFGISNGLWIPKDMTNEIYLTQTGRYTDKPQKNGKTQIKVTPEFMQTVLKDYIKWLKNYKESWNVDEVYDCHPKNKADFIEREKSHESRADILEMVELLQECRIED